VLVGFSENDREGNAYLSGFYEGLAELGWLDGRNLRIDVRWAAGNLDRIRMFAKELVELQPAVIFASGTPQVLHLKQETQVIPIVFSSDGDPIGAGLVASLPRPGGNVTGFMTMEGSGTKPADLPVQLPVKFEMVLNVRTARKLNLDVPPSILLRADEIIE
jgi:putative ABC transport system substrate-binding protein